MCQQPGVFSGKHHHVFDPDAPETGQINTRLNGNDAPFPQDLL
jgi:hypothetical protein